jgi:tetratricopeptide (TPR) repeat protein
MRRVLSSGMIFFALLLLFAGRAAAQGAAVNGTVIGLDGKPLVGAAVSIKNDTGRTFTTKTDKNGNFIQAGVPNGVYTLTLTDPAIPQPYSQQFQQDDSSPKPWNINLKEIAAASGGGAAADAAAKAFAGMKGHFDAGTAAMNDADNLKKQLASATPDQKPDINSKLAADYQTALTEYTAAEQGVNQKDVTNHALIWASIGRVDDASAKYDDASAAYQKAIDLKPSPDYYSDLSTALVNAGVGQHDPAVLQQKITDAGAACDKGVQLASAAPAPAAGGNPAAGAAPAAGSGAAAAATVGARCYKNMGIVLSNKGDLQQAIDPLKKASDIAPKDPQVWFLLGSAYAGSVQSKTEGDKVIYTFDPGTGPALQQCIQLDPDGPLGKQCKDVLDGVNSMGAGISTTVGTPQKKKSK